MELLFDYWDLKFLCENGVSGFILFVNYDKLIYGRSVAQLVEQWSPKPPVAGSNPATPASFLQVY
jgi:hypothetical protein